MPGSMVSCSASLETWHMAVLIPPLAALFLAGTTGAPSPAARPLLEEEQPAPVAELTAEFELAVAAWREAIRGEEDVKQRSRLRKEHPARVFEPRFQELARSGQGEALLWLIDHSGDIGLKREERTAREARLVGRAFEEHASARWIEAAFPRLVERRRALGLERVELLLRGVARQHELEASRAAALLTLGTVLFSEGEALAPRALATWREVVDQFGTTEAARDARTLLFRAGHLVPGGEPLEFAAISHDGSRFKLSDYRGKVVLLDFWGFW